MQRTFLLKGCGRRTGREQSVRGSSIKLFRLLREDLHTYILMLKSESE